MQGFGAPGLRLIRLYVLLASTPKAHSLHALARMFRCSRQTVLRMLEQLELLEGFEIESWREGREKVYRGKPREGMQDLHMGPDTLRHLMLCRDLVRHLLPENPDKALGRAEGAPAGNGVGKPFGKGMIDYRPFQDHIDGIHRAVQRHTLCKLRYAARHSDAPKAYTVAPVSILAYREALYFRCLVCSAQGKPIEDAPRTLAIQRIRHIENLDHPAPTLPTFPELENFGFPVHAPIKVRVAFTENAADYIRERQWSPDQRIRNRKSGGILLTFSATNQKEVLSWVLSFGPDAELLEPKALRVEMKQITQKMTSVYSSSH